MSQRYGVDLTVNHEDRKFEHGAHLVELIWAM